MNAKTLRKVMLIFNENGIEVFPKRAQRLADVVESLSEEELETLKIEICAHGGGDPLRYGKTKGREGKSAKIGTYYTDKSAKKGQKQIWAVWG
jgi:hypothetical protein